MWNQFTDEHGVLVAKCKVCQDEIVRYQESWARHEAAASHRRMLREQQNATIPAQPLSDAYIVRSGTFALLNSLAGRPQVQRTLDADSAVEGSEPSDDEDRFSVPFDWNVYAASSDTELPLTVEKAAAAELASGLAEHWLNVPDSDDSDSELFERPDVESDDEIPDALLSGEQCIAFSCQMY